MKIEIMIKLAYYFRMLSRYSIKVLLWQHHVAFIVSNRNSSKEMMTNSWIYNHVWQQQHQQNNSNKNIQIESKCSKCAPLHSKLLKMTPKRAKQQYRVTCFWDHYFSSTKTGSTTNLLHFILGWYGYRSK